MKNLLLFAVFVVLLNQVHSDATTCTKTDEDLRDSANAFGLDLYRKLAETPGNVFFSPISVSFAMAMISLGAKENTLDEILTAMKVTKEDRECMHSWFKSLKGRLIGEKEGISLALANKIFGEKSYSFLDTFLQETEEYYGAQLEGLDFKGDSGGSRRHINDWVSSVTKNKIMDLLSSDGVDPSTKLVLVNAIYFKGEWMQKFRPANTHNQDFHVTPDEAIQVPTMNEKLFIDYGYSAELKSDVIELPYLGDILGMLVILPRLQETSMQEVEKHLTAPTLSALKLEKELMDVWLPKFKIELSYGLNKKMQELGVKKVFDGGDLSGIDGTRRLSLSTMVHKAFIEVTEERTESAASTGLGMSNKSLRPPATKFKADHPFIFLIRDKSSKTVLFLGKLARP